MYVKDLRYACMYVVYVCVLRMHVMYVRSRMYDMYVYVMYVCMYARILCAQI